MSHFFSSDSLFGMLISFAAITITMLIYIGINLLFYDNSDDDYM